MHVMLVYIFFHSSMLLWKKRRGIAIVLQQEASLPDVSTALCFNSLPLVSFIKCLYMHDYILLLSEFYYNNDRTCCATHWDLQNVSSCCSTGPPSPSLPPPSFSSSPSKCSQVFDKRGQKGTGRGDDALRGACYVSTYVVKSSKMVQYCCNFGIELLLDSGSRSLNQLPIATQLPSTYVSNSPLTSYVCSYFLMQEAQKYAPHI